MAIFELRDFSDIYSAVLEELKIQSNDTTALNRVKRIINQEYMGRICRFKPWKWLRKRIDLTHDAEITTGTVSVTQNDKTITFSSAPTESQRDKSFKIDNVNEVYKIRTHAAGATTAELESEYIGSTSTAANYAVWQSWIALPAEAHGTFSISHDHMSERMKSVGIESFRQIEKVRPAREGRPVYYSTGEYIDPVPYEAISGLSASATCSSSGFTRTIVFASDESSRIEVGDRIEVTAATAEEYNGEFIVKSVSTTTITYTGLSSFEQTSTVDTGITVKMLSQKNSDELFRQAWIYPSKYDTRVNLHTDILLKPKAMDADADEPLVPLEDRAVIVKAALATLWRSLGRDSDEADKAELMTREMLNEMASRYRDSTDYAQLEFDRRYLAGKRMTRQLPKNFDVED